MQIANIVIGAFVTYSEPEPKLTKAEKREAKRQALEGTKSNCGRIEYGTYNPYPNAQTRVEIVQYKPPSYLSPPPEGLIYKSKS